MNGCITTVFNPHILHSQDHFLPLQVYVVPYLLTATLHEGSQVTFPLATPSPVWTRDAASQLTFLQTTGP